MDNVQNYDNYENTTFRKEDNFFLRLGEEDTYSVGSVRKNWL
jgi:hypothetical protein